MIAPSRRSSRGRLVAGREHVRTRGAHRELPDELLRVSESSDCLGHLRPQLRFTEVLTFGTRETEVLA